MHGAVTVHGVADDVHRLAGNLVENALIHTPPGTPVTVSVRREGASAVLEVSDRGPGVPLDMRERVFERFARGAGEVAPSGGSGLGLAIVRAVSSAHGGTVEIGDAEGGGARFVVTLPADTSARSDSPASVLVNRGLTPETSKE
jgi:two-component system OmpR family sensor kinase